MSRELSFWSRLGIVAGVLAVGAILFASGKEIYRSRKIEQEIQSMRNETDKLRTTNDELKERIAYFETDDFRDREAKEKLNFQRPDERLVIIQSSPSRQLNINEPDEGGSGEVNRESLMPSKKWRDIFFGYRP